MAEPLFVYAITLLGPNGERVKCFEYKPQLLTCFRFECKTATDSARARTRVASAYITKRGIENSFLGTQMFVQARKKNFFSRNIYLNNLLGEKSLVLLATFSRANYLTLSSWVQILAPSHPGRGLPSRARPQRAWGPRFPRPAVCVSPIPTTARGSTDVGSG